MLTTNSPWTLLALLLATTSALSQTPANTTPRGVVVESNRKELDSLLLRKPITGSTDNAARRATLKQINDDFKDLQSINNKMMTAVISETEPDYRNLMGMISDIGSKARRLESNLALPKLERKKELPLKVSSAEEFKSGLTHLDRTIVSFTTNPLFQKANVVEVDLAKRASEDLSTIIELSGKLKKVALKLRKAK